MYPYGWNGSVGGSTEILVSTSTHDVPTARQKVQLTGLRPSAWPALYSSYETTMIGSSSVRTSVELPVETILRSIHFEPPPDVPPSITFIGPSASSKPSGCAPPGFVALDTLSGSLLSAAKSCTSCSSTALLGSEVPVKINR